MSKNLEELQSIIGAALKTSVLSEDNIKRLAQLAPLCHGDSEMPKLCADLNGHSDLLKQLRASNSPAARAILARIKTMTGASKRMEDLRAHLKQQAAKNPHQQPVGPAVSAGTTAAASAKNTSERKNNRP